MTLKLYILALLILFLKPGCNAQQFIVKLAPFSSLNYDEFSPVYYNNGLVYCSNLGNNSLISYKNAQGRLFKIFYVSHKESKGWKKPAIFSRDITSAFNDGPVTFNDSQNVVYFSRNNVVETSIKNSPDSLNKLGIYSAVLENGQWINIKPFTYNNPLYSFCTPAITPDGKRIFFSSDQPGGYGGMDLYYCDRLNNDWDKPVNMGPAINTGKNESFPFATKYGKLYFASDGHNGNGGKDIYYTQQIKGIWIDPVHMDSTINSPFDDFGIVLDSTDENGFFSTNRLKSDDIFSLNSQPVQFTNCDTIKENNFCFTFYDEQHQVKDTIPVIYKWDFGNGIVRIGPEVKHCFPGPGEYSVKLSIVFASSGVLAGKMVDYKVDLENIEQAYINSYSLGIRDKSFSFDALKSNLTNFHATDYLWDFGDGFKRGSITMTNSFSKKGEYAVRLGLLGAADSLGVIPKKCIIKFIKIYNTYQEFSLKTKESPAEIDKITEPGIKNLQTGIYLMDDLTNKEKSEINNALSESDKFTIKFNSYGIMPSANSILNKITDLLKNNPDIKLNIVLHSFEAPVKENRLGISEKWAQEMKFFFKNNNAKEGSITCTGFDNSYQGFIPILSKNKNTDGLVDFIFTKN